MKRKQIIAIAIVVVVLAALVYLQFREWRRFDWEKFAEGTEGVNYWKILAGIALIYVADFLRAIRWKIFLRPTRPKTPWHTLIAPQYVGFAGLALLGRPGELIRPYLIAKKANSTLFEQMAIWAVERVFDIGGVAVILVIDIFFVPSVRQIEYYEAFRKAGYALVGIVGFLALVVMSLSLIGPKVARGVCRALTPISASVGENAERKVRAFSEGLNAVRDLKSFAQVSLISLVLWFLVALAYRQVTHAYPIDTGLPDLDLPQVILLMGASVAGGVLQLPVIGGGSQLATIAVLNHVFDTGPELAVSGGILFWLVTFMSVAPAGLILARFEHVSIRKLSAESEAEEQAEEATAEHAPPNS